MCPGRAIIGAGPLGKTCSDCAYSQWLGNYGVCRLMELAIMSETLSCGYFRPKESGDDLRVLTTSTTLDPIYRRTNPKSGENKTRAA